MKYPIMKSASREINGSYRSLKKKTTTTKKRHDVMMKTINKIRSVRTVKGKIKVGGLI